MTNEEIYKYADKKLKKQENKVLLKYFVVVIVWIIGAELMIYPIHEISGSIDLVIMLFILISFLAILILFAKALTDVWFKPRRNYIYNLVRADERNRLQVSKR